VDDVVRRRSCVSVGGGFGLGFHFVFWFFALSFSFVVSLAAQDARAEVAGFLRGVGFAADEVARLEGGQVLTRADLSGDESEILAVGAVKIRADRDRVANYYGQMISYVDGQVTQAFGRFSTPPALTDVQTLTLDAAEIEALKSCRPGDCDIRLGGTSLSALRSSVNWKAANYSDEVHRYLRQTAVAYVTAYQKRGDAALVTYDDRARPVSLRQQWEGILANAVRLQQLEPALRDYLAKYPSQPLPGGRDVFYWSKESYGLKPIVSIVHGVVYEPPGRPDRVFVVQKQLYASHYFDASLAMGTVLTTTENSVPVSYLLYANRSRGDLLKGGFGGLRRNVARRQAQAAAEQTLMSIKQTLEKSP
jgi:hypothetical protein